MRVRAGQRVAGDWRRRRGGTAARPRGVEASNSGGMEDGRMEAATPLARRKTRRQARKAKATD